MKKLFTLLFAFTFMFLLNTEEGHAQGTDTYKVVKGDSMWKISVKYEIGLDAIIRANPQVKNPALIYPDQILNIPNIDNVKSVEQTVLTLVNKERAKLGLNGLQMDWELQRTARYKSQDMRDKGYFSHQSPTYGSPFDMMKAFGIKYRTAGENIAQGQQTAEQVMKSWMNSAGHRKNILSKDFTHIGVGYVSNGNYWTQMFIGK